ncbi:hypothetical protein FA13DRAFT_1740933 [Coprinellus micaceus]|uniref:Uncharacterized protein n=1 Tax=Coprinellus micaceus TaxID=71717 RepID=A0A4Y7SL15_COPMI|nr:hypothetical protein FA13DRAFT_1740933 [Coprinellus micaceus]
MPCCHDQVGLKRPMTPSPIPGLGALHPSYFLLSVHVLFAPSRGQQGLRAINKSTPVSYPCTETQQPSAFASSKKHARSSTPTRSLHRPRHRGEWLCRYLGPQDPPHLTASEVVYPIKLDTRKEEQILGVNFRSIEETTKDILVGAVQQGWV